MLRGAWVQQSSKDEGAFGMVLQPVTRNIDFLMVLGVWAWDPGVAWQGNAGSVLGKMATIYC